MSNLTHERLLVIADVHGQAAYFRQHLAYAARNELHVVQVGDLINKGPTSPQCMEFALEMVASGRGTVVVGNHELKFLRYIRGIETHVGWSLQQTISQLERHPGGANLASQFADFIEQQPLWQRSNDVYLVHGGFHPAMSRIAPMELGSGKGSPGVIAERALFGEPQGYGKRSRSWIGEIPRGKTVIVGHEPRDKLRPLIQQSVGGRAVFLDTGCGKGGLLSSVEILNGKLSRWWASDGATLLPSHPVVLGTTPDMAAA